MHFYRLFILTLTCVLAVGPLFAATSESVQQLHCAATLLTEHDAVKPGEPFIVGLLLEADEHWHTYWRNPGESGMATKIDWTLPEGFEAGEIQWPAPVEFVSDGPIVNFGYEGQVMLLVQITPPADIATPQVTLQAKVTWLVCDPGSCIPGRATLSVDLPVTESEPAVDAGAADRFVAAREGMPRPIEPDRVDVVSKEGDAVTFTVKADLSDDTDAIAFFPSERDRFQITSKKTLSGGTAKFTVPKFDPSKSPEHLRGVLVLGDRAYTIDQPLNSQEP